MPVKNSTYNNDINRMHDTGISMHVKQSATLTVNNSSIPFEVI